MSLSAVDEGTFVELDIELDMQLAGFSNACKVLRRNGENRNIGRD
jgi:hypothetical protein